MPLPAKRNRGVIVLKKITASMAIAACCLALTACKMPWEDAKAGGDEKKNGNVSAPVVNTTTATADQKIKLADFAYINDIKVTDKLPVKVYLDGTASMAGYTNKNAPSVFKTVVKDLEPIFHARWNSNKIDFIRFGDADVPFNGEAFLKFEKEDFYQDKDTRLDNVIKNTDNNNLSIIITDLFQTNQHYTSLSNALETKCFGKQSDRGFAIIGVKSQFQGKIYDIANHAPIEYVSKDGDASTYRPFYMLVVGKDEDVKVFAYEFQRRHEDAKVSLFTNEYGYASNLALGDNFGKTKGGFQNKGDNEGRDKDGVIHVKAKSGDKVNDSLTFISKRLPVEIPNNYTLEITKLEKLTGGSWNPLSKEKAKFTVVDNKGLVVGKTALNFTGASMKSDLAMTVDAKKDNEGKYKVTMGLFTTRESYVNYQDVFKGWNFDENRVPQNELEIGRKTQSISAFTQLVADKHYMQDKPGIHNIQLYLDIE